MLLFSFDFTMEALVRLSRVCDLCLAKRKSLRFSFGVVIGREGPKLAVCATVLVLIGEF